MGINRIRKALAWYALVQVGLLMLAVIGIGLIEFIKTRTPTDLDGEPFDSDQALLLWIVIGAFMFLVAPFAWAYENTKDPESPKETARLNGPETCLYWAFAIVLPGLILASGIATFFDTGFIADPRLRLLTGTGMVTGAGSFLFLGVLSLFKTRPS